jgi:glutamate/tyrosine decarboxylase-like PLP-dependent enzyme
MYFALLCTELDRLTDLASFVHTWMPEEADKLMLENMNKNLIDQDEYPMTRMYFCWLPSRRV